MAEIRHGANTGYRDRGVMWLGLWMADIARGPVVERRQPDALGDGQLGDAVVNVVATCSRHRSVSGLPRRLVRGRTRVFSA